MKLTKSKLKHIIKEEISKILKEDFMPGEDFNEFLSATEIKDLLEPAKKEAYEEWLPRVKEAYKENKKLQNYAIKKCSEKYGHIHDIKKHTADVCVGLIGTNLYFEKVDTFFEDLEKALENLDEATAAERVGDRIYASLEGSYELPGFDNKIKQITNILGNNIDTNIKEGK